MLRAEYWILNFDPVCLFECSVELGVSCRLGDGTYPLCILNGKNIEALLYKLTLQVQ